MQDYLVFGREEGSGWSIHRHIPDSLGCFDRKFGGRIRWRRFSIAAKWTSRDSK